MDKYEDAFEELKNIEEDENKICDGPSRASKIQYNKLTDFIKRLNQVKAIEEPFQSPHSRQSLVPSLPISEENCQI